MFNKMLSVKPLAQCQGHVVVAIFKSWIYWESESKHSYNGKWGSKGFLCHLKVV